MELNDLGKIAQALVGEGKGILAADETPGTLTKRFDNLNITSTPESRRDYREMLFTTPLYANFISSVIMNDETIRQRSSNGMPFPDILFQEGIIPGIKVDLGAKPLAGSADEMVTEGLDGLRDRLRNYRELGAQFAKWRAVIRITDQLPGQACVKANAHALARYAALCQEEGIVPIVEPEVLMNGAHNVGRCGEVAERVLHAVFDELNGQNVLLEGMLLKPSMIVAGKECPDQASVAEVAEATLRCLLRCVPAAVPGIVFLSGGQSGVLATAHLNAISQLPAAKPWKISFSYGRALQDRALATWLGKRENTKAAQQAYLHRSKCNAAAVAGKYTADLENEFSGEFPKGSFSHGEDD